MRDWATLLGPKPNPPVQKNLLHTANPIPALLIGATSLHHAFARGLQDLSDITLAIRPRLNCSR